MALPPSVDGSVPMLLLLFVLTVGATGSLYLRHERSSPGDWSFAAADAHLADLATWRPPQAGMFLWVELRAGREALAAEREAQRVEAAARQESSPSPSPSP